MICSLPTWTMLFCRGVPSKKDAKMSQMILKLIVSLWVARKVNELDTKMLSFCLNFWKWGPKIMCSIYTKYTKGYMCYCFILKDRIKLVKCHYSKLVSGVQHGVEMLRRNLTVEVYVWQILTIVQIIWVCFISFFRMV